MFFFVTFLAIATQVFARYRLLVLGDHLVLVRVIGFRTDSRDENVDKLVLTEL